jgi:purine-cytosine permease-like protein
VSRIWPYPRRGTISCAGTSRTATSITFPPGRGTSIQSRGQFGFYGAAFMFPAVLLLNVGFIAAQLVIKAQSRQGVAGSLTIPQWILLLIVPALVIGIFGYRWIHRVTQATAVVVVGVSLVIMLIEGLRYGSLPAREMTMARRSRPSAR